MGTKPAERIIASAQEHLRTQLEEVQAFLQKANLARNWKDFARYVQAAELVIHSFRFYGARVLMNRRPRPMAMRAQELSRELSMLADEIDDPDQTPERLERLERRVSRMKLNAARAATNRLPQAKDDTFLRAALCDTVENVARLARGPWKSTLPKESSAAWVVMADEVIRLYGENLDPARVPLMRREASAIATAIEACSNRGGRGKVARVHKSEAVVQLCARLGFPAPDYDSITKGNRRKARTKNKQG
ncbi:MAG TPA: hypothetical protein VFK05_29545 [Polyangiaceae bacterium]|nr:hypothetical protein [Polyangiaceae bacterium]